MAELQRWSVGSDDAWPDSRGEWTLNEDVAPLLVELEALKAELEPARAEMERLRRMAEAAYQEGYDDGGKAYPTEPEWAASTIKTLKEERDAAIRECKEMRQAWLRAASE